jgi:hypothetical protein
MSKYVWELTPPIGEVSLTTIQLIQSITGAELPTSEQFAGAVAVMIGLSFLCGAVYHIARFSGGSN